MKHKPVKQHEFFSIKGEKIEVTRRHCPRCGDSFLANHKNRFVCGKCGYSEFPTKMA